MKRKFLEFISLEMEEKGDAYNPQEIQAIRCMMMIQEKQEREGSTCPHNDRETYQNNIFAGTCKTLNSSWIQQHEGVT